MSNSYTTCFFGNEPYLDDGPFSGVKYGFGGVLFLAAYLSSSSSSSDSSSRS